MRARGATNRGRRVVVLGLGANLGDKLMTMRRAVHRLSQRGVSVTATSAVYQTPPLPIPASVSASISASISGRPDLNQPPYLNAALSAEIPYGLERLLAHIREVEASLGRVRPDPVRWGPRTIDLDILWTPGPPHRTDALQVPHPRLQERDFALRPLVEVAPDACDPAGRPYAALPLARRPMAPRFSRL